MASVELPKGHDYKSPPKISQHAKRLPHTPRGELDDSVNAADAASLWAIATRRNIDLFLESELPLRAEDLEKFIKEVAAVFIAALQRNSLKQWQYVSEVLKILGPYIHLLNSNTQLLHYVERTVYQVKKLQDQDLANDILQSINHLFSKSLIEEKQTVIGDTRNYRTPTPSETARDKTTAKSNGSFTLPDGSHPYRLTSMTDDVKIQPKGISFGDLSDVMPSIILETVKHDAIWSDGLGLTAAALSIKLPTTTSEVISKEPIPPRQPDATWSKDAAGSKKTKAHDKIPQTHLSEDSTPLTGKEVVELFGKGRHLGKAKFVYLNKAKSRHFRPYDLIEVPQHKANSDEHWIVSCFGIMHKVKGQPSESMALYDWHREAVLWSALMKIPFFKYFLVRKAFHRWKSNQKFNDFSTTRQRVESRLLQAIPRFGTSLLQISKLLQELRLLRLLPLEPNHCFTLSEFDLMVLQKYREGKLILGKFFNFCKMILDKTCKDSIDKLKFCESQTKQDKAVFSKESLYVQRQKKEHRKKNLAMSQEEASCLGNYVLLVDQILVSHLLSLTRINICSFVEDSMAAGPDCERDALFSAKLIFTKEDTLTLFPDKEKFHEVLKQTLDNIPALIVEMARPMEELTTGLVFPQENTQSTEAYERGTGTTPDPDALAIQLEAPDLPEIGRPRKSRDNLGVATPSYCIPGLSRADLAIVGERVVGQYNPISHGNLLKRLSHDEKIIASRITQESLLASALADVDAFCEEHSWLSEIHRFVKSWTKDSAKAWRRAQAFSIEAKLAEIRDWTEKVRNVDRMFVTNNALFLVDCETIQTDLVPPLDEAFKDLLNFTASEALRFAGAFTKEIKGVVTDMKAKDPDLSSFADYAQQYHTYKNKMADLQTEVEYIKSLFEVIRLSYRSLTPEEEKHEEQVWQNWEAFLLQLQDAAEFVHVQMPIKTEEMDERFQQQMAEAAKIFKEATSGVYLDPTQNSTKLLTSVLKLFDKFYEAQSEINKCNTYREKMHGKPYDIEELNKMLSLMRVRTELWKYLESGAAAIDDWRLKVFKKFDVQRAIDKITEWQRAAGHLKQYLPQADPVLAFWYKMLADFKQHLPLLLKLSSDALKYRHWRAIFLALGETYEYNKPYRVMDLLSFNISEKSLAINKICAGAMAEFALEKSLVKLRKLWEEKDFKLAQHLIKGGQVLTSMEQPDDVFILIGIDELKYLLEDSQVSLQNMLISPHLANLRPSAELWRSNLLEVDEIVELISECQSKWLYLYKIFSDAEQAVYDPDLTSKYDVINRKFQEIMKAIASDPKILSILNQRKGHRVWRELQGDNLKEILLPLIKVEEELLKELDHFLTEARLSYPRFSFLNDSDLTYLLAHPTNRLQWVPYIRKLFCGITGVSLALTSDPYGIHKHLDLQLHADKLEAVSIEGDLNECLTLVNPVTPSSTISGWWDQFENSVKSTVGSMLNTCLESRLRDNRTNNPEKILEELATLENNKGTSTEEKSLQQAVKQSFSHWLLRFPAQCVLVAEGVLWFRQMGQVLASGEKENLERAKDHLQSRLQQYTSVLQDNVHLYLSSPNRARLHILLSNLIMQTIQYKDIVQGLLKLTDVSDKCFDWEKVLKYSVDVSTRMRAKYEDKQGVEPKVMSGFVFGPCQVSQLNSSFAYDYEYLGPKLRLVTTPLTDRCHLAMVMAMKQFECGTVLGPLSTGKTECISDLAQIMGRNLVTVDCTNVSNVRMLNHLFGGLVQSGSWGLFENPQRMTEGLLSVFAQRLQHILHAYQVLSNKAIDKNYQTRGISSVKHLRRHSITTILPTDAEKEETGLLKSRERVFITSEKEDEGEVSKMRGRRHSIVRGGGVSMRDHYQRNDEPVPLFINRPKSVNVSPSTSAQHWIHKPVALGHLEFDGQLISAGQNFASFITMTTDSIHHPRIPSNLKSSMRPTSMVIPDMIVILETQLLCLGFQEYQSLAAKLNSLSQILSAQFPEHPEWHLDLRTLKYVLDVSALRMYSKRNVYELTGRGSSQSTSVGIQADSTEVVSETDVTNALEQDELHREENSVVFALHLHLLPRLSDQRNLQAVKDLLRSVFPWGGGGTRPPTGGQDHDPVLLDAIQNQFVAEKLQATPQHVNKVIELQESLQHKCGVILVGPAGSGKTVCYHTLASVLNNLHQVPPAEKEDGHSGFLPQVPKLKGLSESIPTTPSPSVHRMRFKAEVISRLTLQWLEVATQGKKLPEYPAVDVSVIYPATLSLEEIVGAWSEESNSWRDGFLTRMIRDAAASSAAAKKLMEEQVEKAKKKKPFGKGLLSSPSTIEKWLVLDGDVNQTLSELYHPAVKRGNRQMTLANGEQLDIPCSLSLILETTDLSSASPAMVADCAILHFGRDVVHWRSLLDSWLGEVKTLWDCSNTNFQLLTILIEETFPATLDFLDQEGCSFVLETDQPSSHLSESLGPGLREVSNFVQILGALFNIYFKREEVIIDMDSDLKKPTEGKLQALMSPSVSSLNSRPASCNPSVLLSSMFVFSYTWGFAGHLHERYWEQFEAFACHIFTKSSVDILIPSGGSLFNYHVDPTQGVLVSFFDKSQDKLKTLPSGYTVIPQMERYSHLVDLLLPTSPILLCGAPGVGKTALVQNLVHPKHPYTKLHFSPVFSQAKLEESLSSKLRPMSIALNPSLSSRGAISTGVRPTFFIDDVNCCSKNPTTGGIPNLEILRQLFSRGGYYDRESVSFKTLEKFSLLSLCSPPTEVGVGVGEACQPLSPRVTRHLVVLMLTSPDMESVLAVHGGNLTSWLEEFPAYSLARHQELSKAILSATVALHNTVKRRLTCTPTNPHYVFSHHDIHHVISGLHLLSARSRGENRPKHSQRRVAGGQGRRQSQGYRGSLQLSTTAPPMMRSVIRLWCHEVTRTYTDRITSASDMDWFSATLEQTVERYFCVADIPKQIPTSPSLIPEEPSVCSTPPAESHAQEKMASTDTEVAGPGSNPVDASLDHQKALTTSSSTVNSLSLPASFSPPMSESVDSDGQSVSYSRTLSSPASLDRDQQPLPPITSWLNQPTTKEEEKIEAPPLKHEPRPPSAKSPTQRKQVTKERRASKEDKMSHSLRKGVTFKPGLISDSGNEMIFSGPLITMEQLKTSDERLTDITMSKFIATGQRDTEKGYVESSSSQLEEGLRRVLGNYNEISATKMNLAFFEETLYHMARLSRVLATPGGNSLLLGMMHATGRTSLVKLAAFAARCKICTCHPDHDPEENQVKLRGVMKKASQLAGVYGKPVVLLVKSRLGDPSLQDLCCFLKEGTCPGLYTQDELTHIVSQMLPGAKQARGSRAELALEKYFNRVQTYLHVIISMDCDDGTLSSSRGLLQKFPTLLQSVISVDVYRPWSQEAFTRVAEHWIQVPTSDPYTGKLIEPSLTSSIQSPSTATISRAMGYIHLTSYRALLQYHQEDHKVYSPATFLDFIDLFKSLMWKIVKEEKVNISKYQSALDKINEGLQRIRNYESEVVSLRPQYQLALEIAEQKQREVELYQQEFADAKGHCSQDEAEITEMQKPLMEMKKKAQAELDRVNPVYEAALHALRSLDPAALNEIRTYSAPPVTVIRVVNALCLLFREPFGWQSGKALINRDNFFQDLEFYDKANMPDDVFHKLNVMFIQDKTFTPDYVSKASVAAKSLCMWLHAVYDYAVIHRNMRPKITMVEEAEVKLHEAQSHLGQKRVKAQDVQGFLEEKMKEYQESLVHVHNLDKAMKALEDQIAEASHLMMNMDAQHVNWRSSLEKAQNNLSTSVGDALIAAACSTYHGPMEQSVRNKLAADWMKACRSGLFNFEGGTISESQPNVIPIRSDFTVEAILSSEEEQKLWDQRTLLEDPHATHNALYIRACTIALKRHWPLLLDPHNQALSWIKALQEKGMVSYHEGFDVDHDEMRVESVSEREDEVAKGMKMEDKDDENVAGGKVDEDDEDEEAVTEDSTDRETSTLTGIGQEYPETPRTLTSVEFEASFKTPVLEVTLAADSETDIFSSSQQTDKVSLSTIQQDVPKPPLDLMVVLSDDPSLAVKLCQAVVMGYTLMVTHIERAPFADQFRDILRRNVTMGTDGVKKISIGSKEYPYNPKFKLLLCSSVPLGMKGAGLKPLPVRDTILINMAVDQKGLQDILMNDVLSSERPEFKNQLRSIREDIREQQMTISAAEDKILKKTLELPHGVLDEESMLDLLMNYQQVVLTTEVTLQESITLKHQLLGKQRPFLQVAHHGTLLYWTIQKLQRLHPAYYVPQWCFLEWFRDGIRSREKDPTNISAPRARAVELMDNLTRHVHWWVLQWCLPLHGSLFIFMFAAEKMRDGEELTEEEWKMFVGGMKQAENGRRMVEEDDRPDWMDEKTWSDCCHLESTHPAFGGLGKCLVQFSKQWREYFEHQPVLLSPVPGDVLADLSVFQKAILWRIVRPDKVASICHDVAIYQLGSSATTPGYLSLESILPSLGPRKPLLCLLPGVGHSQKNPEISGIEGHLLVDLSDEIERLSIHRGLEKNIYKLTLGTPEQLKEATRLLRHCQQRGHWLLLENCQAVEIWDDHFLNELRTLLETSVDEDGLDEGSPRDHTLNLRPPVHDNFCLFMVMGTDDVNIPPGLILQHSIKMSYTATNSFKTSLRFIFNGASSWLEMKQVRISNPKLVHEMTFSLAFFHAVLSHRLLYPGLGFRTNYYWNENDLHSALDYMVSWSSSAESPRDYSDLIEMVGTHIYGGHTSTPEDLETVQALAASILVPWKDAEQMPSSMGVGSLLGSLLSYSKGTARGSVRPANLGAAIQVMFDSIKDNIDPLKLGLMKIAPLVSERQQSSFLVNSLIDIHTIPGPTSITNFISGKRAHLSLIFTKLCKVQIPSEHSDVDTSLSHLDNFIQSDIQILSSKIKTITSDIELLVKALDGQIHLNPALEKLLEAISDNCHPEEWRYPGVKEEMGVDELVDEIIRKIGLLQNYQEKQHVICYDITGFVRPKGFLKALMMEQARKEYMEVQDIIMEVQTIPFEDPPSESPEVGTYLSGFYLHNASWDTHRVTMVPYPMDSSATDVSVEPVKLPLMWVKPVHKHFRNISANSGKTQSETTHPCPVYGNQELIYGRSEPLMHLSLPCTLVPKIWNQNKYTSPSAIIVRLNEARHSC